MVVVVVVGDDGLTLTVINLCKKKTLKVMKKCVIRSSICKKKEPDTCKATLPCMHQAGCVECFCLTSYLEL